MTISSTTRSVTFIGNGSASVFSFTFKVFKAADILAERLNSSTGIVTTLVLNTDYSVVLNANQNNSPGGTVTLIGGNLATGYTLTITSDLANLQPTEFINQGGFYPEVLTASLDLLTILIQQLQVAVDLAAKNLRVLPCAVTVSGTVYTAPASVAAVFVNGVLQRASDYTVAGDVITFHYTLSSGDSVDALCTN